MSARLFSEAANARVLVFGAHPCDIEIGCGATVARLTQAGAKVTMVNACVPGEVEVRTAEGENGASLLGARHVILLPGVTRVEDIPMYEVVAAMDRQINEVRPDLVLVHSFSDLHWDHGLVNRAAISSLRRTPSDLLAFTSNYEHNAGSRAIGQCFVDITRTIETKMAAVSAHKTQLAKFDLESVRDLARAMGRISGVQYAEVFEVLRMRI